MFRAFREHPRNYRPNDLLLNLFDQSPTARRFHIQYGTLGQLLFNENMAVSNQKMHVTFTDSRTGQDIVYDRWLRQWILYDETIIPWT